VKITGKGWFSIVLLMIFLFFAIDSFNYGPKARLIPLIVVGFSLIFTLIQVAKEVFLVEKKNNVDTMPEASSEKPDDSQKQNADKPRWFFVFYTFIWLCGFTALLHFTNYLIAVPMFLISYVWLVGKVKIVHALGTGLGMTFVMFIMFQLILGVRI